MIDTFASVGAMCFDVTWTNAEGEQRNVIVRPRGGMGVTFVQLDDLSEEKLERVAPAVFLTLETSPGNFQAWAALAEIADKDFVRRFKKGAGADPTASGATRIAGSVNFKANIKGARLAEFGPDPRVACPRARAHRKGRFATPETSVPRPWRRRPRGRRSAIPYVTTGRSLASDFHDDPYSRLSNVYRPKPRRPACRSIHSSAAFTLAHIL
jgi:hypothetical protein